jgi:hypothetical protein
VTVVGAAEIDRLLRDLRQRHARTAAFTGHTLVRHDVVVGLATKRFRLQSPAPS